MDIAEMAAPSPRPRPQQQDAAPDATPVETASIVGANSPFAADAITDEGDADDDDTAAIVPAAAAEDGGPAADEPAVAEPKPASRPQQVAALEKPVEAPEATDPAGLVPRGWKIQIAAAPVRASAQKILDNAKAKAPKVLADATAYTEPVTKGSTTLYRARFGGFKDKEAARKACAYLAKKDFSCLALSD
jgi:D-alanyl-D-alanine carboxypeptidase